MVRATAFENVAARVGAEHAGPVVSAAREGFQNGFVDVPRRSAKPGGSPPFGGVI